MALRRLLCLCLVASLLPLVVASPAKAGHDFDSGLYTGTMELGKAGLCNADGSGYVSGPGLGLPVISGIKELNWRLATSVLGALHGAGTLQVCGHMGPMTSNVAAVGAACDLHKGYAGQGVMDFQAGRINLGSFGWKATVTGSLVFTAKAVAETVSSMVGYMNMQGGAACFTKNGSGPDKRDGATAFTLMGVYQILPLSGLGWNDFVCKGSSCLYGEKPYGYPDPTPSPTPTPTPPANRPPGGATRVSPTQGQNLPASGPHAFTVQATDPDGDSYHAIVTIRSLTGATVATLTTTTVASGSSSTATTTLDPGTYRWTARACDTGSGTCNGDAAPDVVFSVGDSGPVNRPPAVPAQISPAAGHVFPAGGAQSYTIQATDPEGGQYVGMVEVSDLNGNIVGMYFSGPSESGSQSSASGSPRLAGGTYSWRASACDMQGACGGWSASRSFSVGSLNGTVWSDDCTATLVDGWFGSAYIRLGTGSAGPRSSLLCIRADHGTELNSGGQLQVTSFDPLATVTVTPTGGCTPPAGSQVAGSAVGDPSDPSTYFAYSLHRWQTSGVERACVKVQQGAADLVSSGFVFNASGGGQPDVDFLTDEPGNHAEPEAAPPGAYASSVCQTATSGKVRIVNAEVEGAHVWVYARSIPGTTHLCVRGQQGSTGNGGRFTVTGGTPGAPPLIVQPGAPAPDDASSPCGLSVFTHNPPPVVVRRSAPTADPVAVCAGLNGVNVWAFVDPTPGGTPPGATWTAD